MQTNSIFNNMIIYSIISSLVSMILPVHVWDMLLITRIFYSVSDVA